MAATTIQKLSGVVRISQGGGVPRSYFAERGSFIPSSDGTYIDIKIGIDSYKVVYSDLIVNGQTARTQSEAQSLLAAVFANTL